jgi:formylglycine-generating enzyme required for sulfatase activity
MKRCLLFSIILLTGILLQTSYAELFQWTDENGVKHFSTEGAPRRYKAETSDEFNPDTTTHRFARFVRIPAGRYIMGSPPGEKGRDSTREGQRHITIAKDFFMMTTEVTREMWERVMGHRFWEKRSCDKCPATALSLNRIRNFIRQLNQEEGAEIYRLPTEEEWEYACRAGSTTPFYTGNCLSYNQANIYPVFPPYGSCPYEKIKWAAAKRAGRFQANGWGLYDMYGNASEICTTKDPAKKVKYITKGGSFQDPPRKCRSAAFGTFNLQLPGKTVGFRLVKVIR